MNNPQKGCAILVTASAENGSAFKEVCWKNGKREKREKHEKRETDEQNSMQTLGLDSLIAWSRVQPLTAAQRKGIAKRGRQGHLDLLKPT